MLISRSIRVAAVLALAAGLMTIAQPAFALSSGPDQTWRTNGKVWALAQTGNTMFVGGSFTRAINPSGQTQVVVGNVAAFDITTGAFLSTFLPDVENTLATGKPEVDALAVSSDGSTLYIGGSFDTVDGQPRDNFAAVDVATGTQLRPGVSAATNGKVRAIVAGPNLVYFGGGFTQVDGLDRLHLAAISASDGSLSSTWVPSTAAGTDPCPSQLPPGTSCGPVSNGGSGDVHSLALAPGGNGLFVGGSFYYVNGTPRNSLAQVSTVNGSLINWRVKWSTIPSEGPGNPYVGPNVVWAILPTSTNVYIGWGRTPNGIEKYTMSTSSSSGECASGGCVTSLWTRGTPGNAESLALSPDGTRLFVGGHFGTAVLDYQITACGSGVWAHGLISLHPTDGTFFCDWFPQMVPFGGQNAPGHGVNPPNYVGGFALQMTPNALFVGGYFTSISGVVQQGFARFTLTGSPPPPPPVPTITSFSPTSGPQGSSVVVTGTGFTGATAVRFGSVAATSYSVDSDTQVTAVVPGGFTSSPIKITSPGGMVTSSTKFTLTTITQGPPSITLFSPGSGSAGSSVVVTGSAFTGATAVNFGSVAATSYTVDSDTQVTAVVPGGFTHSPIKITTPFGTAKSAANFNLIIPAITGMTPSSGLVGTQVVIAGLGFTGATSVQFFNGVEAGFNVDSDAQITTTVPVGATTGPVSVVTPSGTLQSSSTFTVTTPPPPPPTITSFTPASGPAGTSVVVTGTGFTGATAVNFGSIPAASFTVDSDTQITVIVPSGFAHSPIKVTTPGGTVKSASNFTLT